MAGEAYVVGTRAPRPAARLLATSRMFGLSAGVDWDGQDNVDAILSFQSAIRRGGLLGRGTMLRLDWIPARRDALSIGLHVPFGQPLAGRTRFADVDVDEPVTATRLPLATSQLPPDVHGALDAIARSATMILAYTNLFAEDTARVRYGESYRAAMDTYERGLDEAFGIASGNITVAEAITRRARAGLLTHVILPYDSLFGQVKEHANNIRPLTMSAQSSFADWLRDSTRLAGAQRNAVAAVHARWMGVVEAIHANLLAQWHDSRLVWLPLQLALRADEYDEQAEVDSLIERAIGRPFTDRNALSYLRSSDLPLEIARSILEARTYHAVWTHDFTGRRDDTKTIDEVAFTMVADAYYPALTAAVQRYDSTGKLPAYLIFLDQFYYAQRDGRRWMTILENPLHADVSLPNEPGSAARAAHLRERQMELRAAVARSGVDPRDVKVHVNVTNPSDFSFRSHRIIPPWPFVPDNVMRDHRKIVVYDVDEADPYIGAMLLMGVGIGEHYASATWEDRGYRIRGPAALEARVALRALLRRHGFSEEDIPQPLRVNGADGPLDDRDFVGRALQVHNATGFGPKESSVARAMLYNLAPAGSVIVVPDPLWVSDTWAAMLAGAAARGVRVHIIAPSKANGPNTQSVVVAAEHFVMSRLLDISHRLAEHLQRTGGELRVGLYTAQSEITDGAGRARELREGLRREPWIRELIPFDDATLAVLDQAATVTESDGRDATDIAKDETPRMPKLHAKTQFIARPGAIQALARQPGWDNVIARAMRAQSGQSSRLAEQLAAEHPEVDSVAARSVDELLRGFEQGIPEAERKAFSFYFSLGTQNMDPRGMLMDGEATIVVSGLQAAVGLVDLYHIMARSTWVTEQSELDRLLPPPGALMRKLSRMIRLAL